jgi:hypothetical protein
MHERPRLAAAEATCRSWPPPRFRRRGPTAKLRPHRPTPICNASRRPSFKPTRWLPDRAAPLSVVAWSTSCAGTRVSSHRTLLAVRSLWKTNSPSLIHVAQVQVNSAVRGVRPACIGTAIHAHYATHYWRSSRRSWRIASRKPALATGPTERLARFGQQTVQPPDLRKVHGNAAFHPKPSRLPGDVGRPGRNRFDGSVFRVDAGCVRQSGGKRIGR